MKGKTRDEARAELEKQGVSGAKLDLILPHKVNISWRCALLGCISVNCPNLGGTCPALPADVPLSRSHSSMSHF